MPENERTPFGLTLRLFDVWVEWSVFEPFDEPQAVNRAREALWRRFGSQEAVLAAKHACEAAGGIRAAEPQAAAVVNWRAALREVLADAIKELTAFDEEAASRILHHANRKRCHIDVGRQRPAEFGGPMPASAAADNLANDDWRHRWVIDMTASHQATHASGVAFEIDGSVPELCVQRVRDSEAEERLEGAWQVQNVQTVYEQLRAQALQLLLKRRVMVRSA